MYMYSFSLRPVRPIFSQNIPSQDCPTCGDSVKLVSTQPLAEPLAQPVALVNPLVQENDQLKQQLQQLTVSLEKSQTELKLYKEIAEYGNHPHSRPAGIYKVKINRLPANKLKIQTFDKAPSLPAKIDLRSKFPPVIDQGDLGSCTACAISGLVGYDIPGFIGSPLFMYYNECVLEGHVGDDSGATVPDTIATLAKYGICPESDWPYNINNFAVKPPTKAYTNGTKHKAIKYANILNTLNGMKQSLVSGCPFILGITVYSSFETMAVERTGMVPMPSKRDSILGGHAVVCVGYDDSKQRFIMRNSWGPLWGDKGYFYLPYAYLLNIDLASDLWCVSKMT